VLALSVAVWLLVLLFIGWWIGFFCGEASDQRLRNHVLCSPTTSSAPLAASLAFASPHHHGFRVQRRSTSSFRRSPSGKQAFLVLLLRLTISCFDVLVAKRRPCVLMCLLVIAARCCPSLL
jgi:hypothetical protein